MADGPLVSVITPTCNRAHMLPRAIKSVLSQTHDNLEHILVDDCSTDDTPEVASSIKDPRLRYIRLPENVGVVEARNVGLEAAQGEYVCFLDDDDEIFPEKLRLQLERFSITPPHVGLVYCGSVFRLEEGQEEVLVAKPVLKGRVYGELLGKNYLTMFAPLVRRECFDVVGRFDPALASCSDWDMWIRISRDYDFDFVPDILGATHIHGEQISSDLKRKIAAREHILHKYEQELAMHPASLAESLRRLGILYCLARDPRSGRSCFRRAMATGHSRKSLYAHLLLANFSPSLHARMLEERFTLRVGEHRYLL